MRTARLQSDGTDLRTLGIRMRCSTSEDSVKSVIGTAVRHLRFSCQLDGCWSITPAWLDSTVHWITTSSGILRAAVNHAVRCPEGLYLTPGSFQRLAARTGCNRRPTGSAWLR